MMLFNFSSHYLRFLWETVSTRWIIYLKDRNLINPNEANEAADMDFRVYKWCLMVHTCIVFLELFSGSDNTDDSRR